MAYGKKNVIKIDPLQYNLGLIGLGGIGKTTIIKEMCEKLAGEDGYLFAECGHEDGADAINNLNYINCTSMNGEYDELTNSVGFKVLIDDILENKDTEYPHLKTLVVDTYDQLKEIADKEVVRLHNKKNPEKKVESVKAAFGGYMAGEDMADDMILDMLWSLKTVGVHFIIIGHTKLREISDPILNTTYTQLTTDMSMRSFNKIKTKLHILGVASISRDIVKEKSGSNKERNVIKSESRRITFRDDNYNLDAKSRFADIVDEIPFDSDALIKALTDAIKAEAEKGGKSMTELAKEQKKLDKAMAERTTENSAKAREKKAEAELEENRDDYIATIQEKFQDADAETKKKAKELLASGGVKKFTDPELSITILKEIAELF